MFTLENKTSFQGEFYFGGVKPNLCHTFGSFVLLIFMTDINQQIQICYQNQRKRTCSFVQFAWFRFLLAFSFKFQLNTLTFKNSNILLRKITEFPKSTIHHTFSSIACYEEIIASMEKDRRDLVTKVAR